MAAMAACAAPAEQPADGEACAAPDGETGEDVACAPQPAQAIGMPNPMAEQADASAFEALGLYIDAPEGATDAKYFIVSDEFVQVAFALDGAEYTYRASTLVDTETLHGVYETFDEAEKSVEMDGLDLSVRIRTVSGGSTGTLATWSIGDINFTLWTANAVDAAAFEALATGLATTSSADCTGAHPAESLQ